MCTVTWRTEPDGYSLFFNRDEKRTREPAEPPSRRVFGSMPVLSPRDPDGGGTWLAVNAAGVSVGLLNFYHADAGAPPEAPVSRGRLVHELAAATGVPQLLQQLAAMELTVYRGFCLVVLDRSGAVCTATWDHRKLIVEREVSLPLTSSSFRSAEVIAGRQAQYREQFGRAEPPSDEAALAFHKSHRPEQGPFSVCMHRPDAATLSFSHIRVDRKAVTYRYCDGAPCSGRRRFESQLLLI